MKKEELEDCTFFDETFLGLGGTYDPDTEELKLDIPGIVTDDESLMLMTFDRKLKNIEDRLEKIESILLWENID